ncbi:methyl-accepting chemotaxis protein [Shewanella woodyi]|uniref:Methyl-accepting chemotaxis sensory transducer n=1 Tax=Shewanella woodyi (strain ATCC 51908 / MS32) TaxID=392500 RepID=B1KJ69_SHEWM|nr:methyl-accepting chemotaxis protein [Shewanella woodyi]ACA87089.1 methyl-accepting chemotaxis sensory transducer [Shewanella woodyi ATCC 51908]
MLQTIRSKLISGIVLLLVLLSITAGTGLFYVFKLDLSIKTLSEDVTPTIENTDDMIASLWERGKVANEIMASESMEEIELLHEQFPPLNQVFDESYEALKNLLDSDEVKIVSMAVSANESLIKNTELMYNAHFAELEEEEKAKRLLDDFDNIGGQLITALDEFATENEAEMAKAEDRGDYLANQANATARDVNDILGELFERDYPVVEAALKLQRYIIEMQDTAGEYLAEEDAANLTEIRKNFDILVEQVFSLIVILETLAETAEDKQDTVDLKNNFVKWQSLALKDELLFDTYRDQLEQEVAADRYTEDLESFITLADTHLEKLAESADNIADSADEKAAVAVRTAVTMVATIWVFALVFGVMITFVLIRAIIKPVDALLSRLNDIAKGDGDLTQRVDESGNDEIAALGKAFNGFVEKIQTMISQISKASEELNDSIGSISELSNRLSDRVEVQSQEVESVVGSIFKVNDAADSISSNTQKCSEASRSASEDGKSATQVVQQAINSVQGLAKDIDLSSTVIDQLNSEVAKIVTVLSVIRDIAEQTNLLALNAAIEAARAGEQGRGFAVVADEVRTLASRTQNSTNEIKGMIDSLKKGADDAVDSMQRSKLGGDSTVNYAQNAGDALARISEAVNNVNEMNEQIAIAAEQQRSIVNSANTSAQNVQEVVEESRISARENLEYTNNMRESLSKLSALVGQFKV